MSSDAITLWPYPDIESEDPPAARRNGCGRTAWKQGRFIATERGGDDPLTVAISSPHATALSWSYWPCTDIDLSFGTVTPSVPTTISGTIRFLRGRLADVVEELREPAFTTPGNRAP